METKKNMWTIKNRLKKMNPKGSTKKKMRKRRTAAINRYSSKLYKNCNTNTTRLTKHVQKNRKRHWLLNKQYDSKICNNQKQKEWWWWSCVVKLNDDATMKDLLVWFDLSVRTKKEKRKRRGREEEKQRKQKKKQITNTNKNERNKEKNSEENNERQWMIRK